MDVSHADSELNETPNRKHDTMSSKKNQKKQKKRYRKTFQIGGPRGKLDKRKAVTIAVSTHLPDDAIDAMYLMMIEHSMVGMSFLALNDNKDYRVKTLLPAGAPPEMRMMTLGLLRNHYDDAMKNLAANAPQKVAGMVEKFDRMRDEMADLRVDPSTPASKSRSW